MDNRRIKHKRVLVTGASGFLGRAICRQLSSCWQVTGFNKSPSSPCRQMRIVRGCISDTAAMGSLIDSVRPHAVVHCAGIAHQKAGKEEFNRINHLAVELLAKAAAKANPAVHFIFLSSISVYGESNLTPPVKETQPCRPSSPYATSKHNAEKSLTALFNSRRLNKLDILRIAPVYDSAWSFNLDKRVFGPKKLFYVRFGSGRQQMSVLARQNLADFIEFRLAERPGPRFMETMNICDPYPCTFNTLIDIFKASNSQPNRGTLPLPLGPAKAALLLAGGLMKQKERFDSHYHKLSTDLVFDTGRMLETGFTCRHDIRSVLNKADNIAQ